MRNFLFRLGVQLPIIGALASCATSPQSIRNADEESLLKILPASVFVGIRSGTPCDAETSQPCQIDIEPITFQSKTYCLAKVPQVTVKYDQQGSDKTVVWQLSRSELDSKPLKFSDGHGIVIALQVPSNGNAHVKHGGLGNGSHNSDRMYHMRVDKKFPKKEDDYGTTKDYGSTYLPVILWGPPGKEELCAATDPKIVNVP